jgi:hypothetical protein
LSLRFKIEARQSFFVFAGNMLKCVGAGIHLFEKPFETKKDAFYFSKTDA